MLHSRDFLIESFCQQKWKGFKVDLLRRMFFGCHRDLVNRHGMSELEMTTDMFRFWL